MSELGMICLVVIAALAGFLVAWRLRGRQVTERDRRLADANRTCSTAAEETEELRIERAGLQAMLQAKVERLAEIEVVLTEKAGVEAQAGDYRQQNAGLAAESESRRLALEERDGRIGQLEAECNERAAQVSDLQSQVARLEAELGAERQAAAEKLTALADVQTGFRDAFKALSADALRENNQTFLELARTQLGEFQTGAAAELEQRQAAIDELVTPIRLTLEQVDGKLRDLETTRAEAHGALTTQLQSVVETQRLLQCETSNLVRALRAPSVRGRWGEMQLRRVVELAGMAEHCDFTEQPVADGPDGRVRPDLIVHLPAGKQVVVDAKAPLDAYLRALEAPDETARAALLGDHARQVREHMTRLASKAYWEQFEQTPDHVVMFIPGEVFFFAALQHDPELIEYGVRRNVFVAGPSTLISLLRTVAYGWRQERIAMNAEEISRNGRELYERIGTLAEHLRKLGSAIDRSVETYNQAIGSLESRVLVRARRFRQLGAATGAELDVLDGIERTTRRLQAAEFRDDDDVPPILQPVVVPGPELDTADPDELPF